MYHVLRYSNLIEGSWDRFVDQDSVNGTFLQSRRFLNYHTPERFSDHSLCILNEKEQIIAAIPACEVITDRGREMISHKGSTYGGIIVHRKHHSIERILEIIAVIEEYLRQNKFDFILLKQTPNIFSRESGDALEFCLRYNSYTEYSELNTYIDLEDYQDNILSNFDQGKRTHVNNCLKECMEFRPLADASEIEAYYGILCRNLEKYGVKPVHSLQELLDFKQNRLVSETGFYGVFHQGCMIAGGMLFYFRSTSTAHTQYLSAEQTLNKLSPISFLYYSVIKEMKARGFRKISWGISTEDLGSKINYGLLKNKESYGSKYSLNRSFFKEIK